MALHFTPQEHDQRIARARRALVKEGLSALLVFAPESHFYLTGYDSVGYLFFQCAVLTADETPMAVSYATSPYHVSQEHTGTQVRIAATGPLAGNVVGVTDQTDLFRLMVRAMMTSARRPPTQP